MKQPLLFGPIKHVYVGDFGDDGVLTKVNAKRTRGGSLIETTPRTWVTARRRSIQSGQIQFTWDLTFYSADDTVIKLARRLLLTETDLDAATTDAKYVLLLIGPAPTSKRNYLFLECETVNPFTDPFQKRESYTQTITFGFRERDRSVWEDLFFRRTASDLGTILDERSPI